MQHCVVTGKRLGLRHDQTDVFDSVVQDWTVKNVQTDFGSTWLCPL